MVSTEKVVKQGMTLNLAPEMRPEKMQHAIESAIATVTRFESSLLQEVQTYAERIDTVQAKAVTQDGVPKDSNWRNQDLDDAYCKAVAGSLFSVPLEPRFPQLVNAPFPSLLVLIDAKKELKDLCIKGNPTGAPLPIEAESMYERQFRYALDALSGLRLARSQTEAILSTKRGSADLERIENLTEPLNTCRAQIFKHIALPAFKDLLSYLEERVQAQQITQPDFHAA